ncbi:MAG: PspC domain-containing protein [Bacillota bacterium]|nr:PspC domain-containing protein [Bacillota bacterium]
MDKRLYRSRDDRVIAGVCGGLAEYLKIDANLVRLVWALFSFPGAIGLPLYILAWILVPEAPGRWVQWHPAGDETGEAASAAQPGQAMAPASGEQRGRWAGAILLILGALFLLENLLPWFHLGRLWPVALIVVGVALLVRGRRPE